MKTSWLPFLCLVPLVVGAANNGVVNGDFTQMQDGQPVGWATYGNARSVDQRLEIGEEAGSHFARLVCTRCEKVDSSSHAMVAQVGKVHLEKGKLYEFSCRVRAEKLASQIVSVAISDTASWQNCGLSGQIPVTSEWGTFTTRFRASRTVGDSTRLQFWYGEPGIFCLADVCLVEATAVAVEMTDTIPPGESRNLLPNASFECGTFGWSSLGQEAGWGNLSGLLGELVSDQAAPHGGHYLRIPLGGDRTPMLYFDYLVPVAKQQLQPLVANVGWLKVQTGQPYTLSCFMRANVAGIPAVLGLRLRNPDGSRWDRQDDRHPLTLGTEWKRYSVTFTPRRRAVFVTVGPALETDCEVVVDIDAIQLEAGAEGTDFVPRNSVEVGIEPSAPAGIFTAGRENYLQLRASRGSLPPVTASATDYFGQDVPVPSPTAEGRIVLPADWRGYYRLQLACAADPNLGRRPLSIAVVPPPVCPDTVVGINHAFADGALIRLARLAGVTWYRDWSLKWQDLEPAQGEFHWDVGDTQIDRVLAERVNLMALLPPFPSANWSSEAPEALGGTGYPGTRIRQAWAPKQRGELARFIGQAVGHCGDRVKVWEFLNEPVYTDYALPGREKPEYDKAGAKRYTVQDYVDLLKLASGAMKQADPNCTVIGGIGGWPDHYALEAIAKGCLDGCDILNLHIYPGIRQPEAFIPQMEELIKAMEAVGKRRPVWMTEFSYYGSDTYPRTPFIPDSGNWAAERLLRDERQCADYTIRFYTIMLSFGVEKVFIHSGASAAVNGEQFECCLFDYGGVPKKVFPALAVFTDLMGSKARPVGSERLGESGYSYSFQTERGLLTVLWDPANQPLVPVPAGSAVYDLMGQPIPAQRVALGSSPVYFLKRR